MIIWQRLFEDKDSRYGAVELFLALGRMGDVVPLLTKKPAGVAKEA